MQMSGWGYANSLGLHSLGIVPVFILWDKIRQLQNVTELRRGKSDHYLRHWNDQGQREGLPHTTMCVTESTPVSISQCQM